MLEEKITEVVDKLVLLSEQLAAPAFQTMLKAIQIESIWFLVVGIGLAISLPLLYGATHRMIRVAQATGERDSNDATVIAQAGLSVVLGLSVIVAAIGTAATLLDVSNWIGAFDPAAEVARRIIEQ